jgi:ATP-binding cassette subfamily F protein 3
MMFSGDDALKKIGVLSGGEKSRVLLAKLLVTPANLLLLDEPTHHLDMESCDALLAALVDFAGTVVMVTHNEMFLNALADRLIVFQNDGIEVFEGNYAEFLESGGWQDEKAGDKSALAEDATADSSKLTKKEKRRLRSEIIAERSRAIKKLETRIKVLENEIAAGEQQLNNLNAEILEASRLQDGPRIEALSKSLHAANRAVDRLYAELEKQSAIYDEQRAAFDERLEQV